MANIQSFTPETVDRIRRTVREVLGDDKRRRPERRRKNAIPTGNLSLAKNGGSAISARSGTTVGSGNVTLYTLDGTTLTAQDGTVNCYNIASSAVAANAYLIVAMVAGKWFAIVEDC